MSDYEAQFREGALLAEVQRLRANALELGKIIDQHYADVLTLRAEVERLTLLSDRRGETIAELRKTAGQAEHYAKVQVDYAAQEQRWRIAAEQRISTLEAYGDALQREVRAACPVPSGHLVDAIEAWTSVRAQEPKP
jgi:hypothetical protein